MTTPGQGPSDFRFTAFDFEPAKYESMMSSFETVRAQLKDIPDLRIFRIY